MSNIFNLATRHYVKKTLFNIITLLVQIQWPFSSKKSLLNVLSTLDCYDLSKIYVANVCIFLCLLSQYKNRNSHSINTGNILNAILVVFFFGKGWRYVYIELYQCCYCRRHIPAVNWLL